MPHSIGPHGETAYILAEAVSMPHLLTVVHLQGVLYGQLELGGPIAGLPVHRLSKSNLFFLRDNNLCWKVLRKQNRAKLPQKLF